MLPLPELLEALESFKSRFCRAMISSVVSPISSADLCLLLASTFVHELARVPFREVVNSQSNPSAVDSPDTIVQNRLEELRNPHAPAAINAALSILIMYKMACGQTAFNLHASYDAIGRDVTNFLGKEGYTGWYITGSSKKKTVSKPYKSSREVCYILFPECDTHCFCSHV